MELELPPEIVAKLHQKAAAAGMNAEQLAIATLQEGLTDAASSSADVMLPRDQWKATFDALIAKMPIRDSDSRVDCSRESIYGDR